MHSVNQKSLPLGKARQIWVFIKLDQNFRFIFFSCGNDKKTYSHGMNVQQLQNSNGDPQERVFKLVWQYFFNSLP